MPQILCPYCCSRFDAAKVHFRYDGPLINTQKVQEEVPEENADDGEVLSARRGRNSNKNVDKDKRSVMDNDNFGKELDLKMVAYMKNFGDPALEQMQIESYSMQYPYLVFDAQNPNQIFDANCLHTFGYVESVIYEGQRLTKRICPECHMPLVQGAGKYEMFMFSMVGNTSAGKSVYLASLIAYIRNNNKYMTALFMGNDDESRAFKEYEKITQTKNKIDATDTILPPFPYLFTYPDLQNPGNNKQVLVMFRDVMGERLQEYNRIDRYARHIKASSGVLFMYDPSEIDAVAGRYNIKYENGEQSRVFDNITRYLLEALPAGVQKINVPFAFVIAKSDLLKGATFFQGKEYMLDDGDWAIRNPGYISMGEIDKTSNGAKDFLNYAVNKIVGNQVQYLRIKNFFCSSLGHNPTEKEQLDKQWLNIQPFCITDPFYWLLYENGVMTRLEQRKYRNSKSKVEKTIQLFLKAGPCNLDQAFDNAKIAQNMKDGFFSGKWERIE